MFSNRNGSVARGRPSDAGGGAANAIAGRGGQPAPPAPELVVADLCAGYGAMQVVDRVGFTVAAGEVVAVVGRNGAGKTTTLAAVAGLRRGRTCGQVRLGGTEVSSAPPEDIVARGLALVPEGHRIFPDLTVLENLRMGMFPWRRRGGAELRGRLSWVYELFPVLAEFAQREAGRLSGGQQQMVAIGQALMAQPRVLLLDEPTSGLAPAVIDDIYDVIAQLSTAGTAVVVVEQNLDRALAASSRAYVMDSGRIVLTGDSADLRDDHRVGAIIHGLAE
ncbi:ABC transporter ATP-binding protein [Amycolatopsis rubida]|uniref:Branched-chain amino acid transport system ATP-binding protein n=1 Tax=Amycolatopsis rubida TaxID=112413 RepID=A0A1I5SHJ3_9PSEU|nr:ABC transporter ATP-binding protein [Amycolatopsis rubida]SFP69836.1 branched-chain amino acid transport system ATP-binding protein [Amycolatopsis rubida]